MTDQILSTGQDEDPAPRTCASATGQQTQTAGAGLGERHQVGALRITSEDVHGAADDAQVHLADNLRVPLRGIQQGAATQRHRGDGRVRRRIEPEILEQADDLPPGRGVVPFEPYLREIKDLGVDGAVSIELEYSPEPDKIVEWVSEAYRETDKLLAAQGLRS